MAFETSAVRQGVAGYLSAGGQRFLCDRLTVTKTGVRHGDTFHATIPIDAAGGFGESFWADQGSIMAEAVFSVGGQQKTLITGSADEIATDWINRSVQVSGRDDSSILTQTRINKEYVNQTSAEIVQDIAQMNNLQARISASKGDDVSKSYDIDTAHLILNRTPFEAISILAEREGVQWFVDGDILYFGPVESGGSYKIEYHGPQNGYMTANVMSLVTKRNLVAAQTVMATAKSWHQKEKMLHQYTAKAASAGEHGGQKAILGYTLLAPGMNQQEVETLAKSQAEQAIRHEMCIEVEMPGDLSLDVKQKIELTGTGTLFDQSYDIDELSFDFEAGEDGFFAMHIIGKSALEGRSAS